MIGAVSTWSTPFSAPRRVELPFVFGTPDAWRDAPMLAGASPEELASLVDSVQPAWISFAREGNLGRTHFSFT